MRYAKQATRKGVAAGCGCTNHSAKMLEDRDASLYAGSRDACENLLGPSAPRITVASKDLSIGYRRTDGLIGRPTGGLEPGLLEEKEEFVVMSLQMPCEPGVDWVGKAPAQEPLQSSFQPTDRDRQTLPRDLSLVPAVAQTEGVSQKVQDRAGKAYGSSSRALQNRPTSSLDVSHALLMISLFKEVVGHPAIVNHVPGPVGSQHLLRNVVSPAVSDLEERGRAGDDDPHPLEPAADLPSGLVGIDHAASPDDDLDPAVGGLGAIRDAHHDLRRSAARQKQSEEVSKDHPHVAVRNADLVLKERRHGLGIGSQLSSRCSKGVGGLERMASLHMPAAALTMSDGYVEPSDDRLLRDLLLILRQGLIQDGTPATLAATRQRDRDNLVDVIRDGAMSLVAIVPAGLSAAAFGIGNGVALGKRGGLPPLGAKGFVELLKSRFELPLEIGDAAFELRCLLAKLGVLPPKLVEFFLCLFVAHRLRVSPEIQHRWSGKDSSRWGRRRPTVCVSDSSSRGWSYLKKMRGRRRFAAPGPR